MIKLVSIRPSATFGIHWIHWIQFRQAIIARIKLAIKRVRHSLIIELIS